MDLPAFLDHLNRGLPVEGGSPVHQFMHQLSQEALAITGMLNTGYHPPEEIRALFSQLIGKPVDESFTLFPLLPPTAGRTSPLGRGLSQRRLSVPGPRGHYHRQRRPHRT